MNLLGMKRKLLPYGMPLGGAMGALGAFGGGGGSQSAAPTSAAPQSGGKSSGLGQGGYGSAPSFGQQVNGIANNNANAPMQSAQNQPSSTFSPYGASPISSVNSTTTADMMGGNRGGGQGFGQALQSLGMMGGKSSGLGQGGYGGAPGFGGQQQPNQMGGMGAQVQVQQRMSTPEELQQQRLNPAPQLSPAEQQRMQAEGNNLMNQVRNSSLIQRMFSGMGGQTNPIDAQQQMQLQPRTGNFDSLDMTQDAQRQRQMQGGMGGGFGGQQPQQFNPMRMEQAYFNQMAQQRPQPQVQRPQQQFNPFQQQFGGFQQPRQQFSQQQPQQQFQDMRGLAELLSLLRGRG
jgi:hypothetical protein